MVLHPELGSDQPIGSDWESGCDSARKYKGEHESGILISNRRTNSSRNSFSSCLI